MSDEDEGAGTGIAEPRRSRKIASTLLIILAVAVGIAFSKGFVKSMWHAQPEGPPASVAIVPDIAAKPPGDPFDDTQGAAAPPDRKPWEMNWEKSEAVKRAQLEPRGTNRQPAVPDERKRATATRLLTLAHPDWRQVYASPEFKTWKATLPPEAQTVLDTSWDSAVLTDALDDFKAWKASGKKGAGSPDRFDVNGARAAGYSDQEIATHLASKDTPAKDQIDSARRQPAKMPWEMNWESPTHPISSADPFDGTQGLANTPSGKLAIKAGRYLTAAEYASVFKTTKCGYAIKKTIPTVDQILNSEIIPAFPKETQAELRASIERLRPSMRRQAEDYVKKLRDGAWDYDEKTGCGVAAGAVISLASQTHDEWKAARRAYAGTK